MSGNLKIIRRNVAGIDVGSQENFVSLIPHGQSESEIRSFPTFTRGHEDLVCWLLDNRVESVVMEATGVYWVGLYDHLENAGLEIYVVNGAHAKNLSRLKSDVKDSDWLRELHMHGLLRKSFIPARDIRELRTYLRLREDHIGLGAMHINHIQKALDLMNLKIHLVLSQITGRSGLNMLEAILEGERDAEVLLSLCDKRVKEKKGEEILMALEGNYKPEYLFMLYQALQMWEAYQKMAQACDKEIEMVLERISQKVEPVEIKSEPKPIRHHPPAMNKTKLHGMLLTITGGKDPTSLEGVNDMTLLKLIGYTGLDLKEWENEKQFTSWMGLAPRKNQSGKKWKRGYHKGNKEAAQIFRSMARSVAKTQTPLGEFYRRIKAKKGPKIAMKALARKLACMYFRIMVHGMDYVQKGMEEYQENIKQRTIESFLRRAKKLNLNPAELKKMIDDKQDDMAKVA